MPRARCWPHPPRRAARSRVRACRSLLLSWAATLVACGSDPVTEDEEVGRFHPPVAYAPGGSTLIGLQSADVTEDSRPDLLVVARAEAVVQILPATGAGRFGSALTVAAGTDPLRTAVGDVDGDGVADLLAIGHFDNGFLVRRGLGGGQLGPPTAYALRNHGRQIAVTDLNRDGFDDVIAVHDGSGQPIYVTSFLGSASGAMQKAWEYGTNHYASKNVAFGDFDRDGNVDLVVGAGDDRAALLFFAGLGTGSFAAPVGSPPLAELPGASDGTERVSVADLNRDGLDDVVVAHRDLRNMMSVRLGTAGGFRPPSVLNLSTPGDLELGDVDGDGALDAVVSHPEAGAISVLRGVGDGSFAAPQPLPIGEQPEGLVLADLDGDGWLDVAVADLRDHRIRVLLNRARPPG